MLDDLNGWQGELPIPVPRSSDPPCAPPSRDFVAPVTLEQQGWQRRYVRWVRAVDAGAVGCIPLFHLLWRNVVALPVVAVLLSVGALSVVGRYLLWWWVQQLRRRGRALTTLLAVGSAEEVAALVLRTRRSPKLGWRVAGACTSTGTGLGGASEILEVPVIGDLDGIATEALVGRFDAVAVAPAPGWTAVRLQQLAWDLDGSHTALLVDHRMVNAGGPRMRVTAVPGLPLLRLEHPTLAMLPRLVKGATDRLAALVALLLVAPMLISCALAVRRDGGRALCRRPRLGIGGREFALLTFRVTDASGHLTRVGRVLRRHCLDELPQLLNVLSGTMALVGPRPLMPHEVVGDRTAQQRLLVKPGITGLWQVAGDPLADEDVGLDLRYVDGWNPALDLRIVLRALRAALSDQSRTG